MGEATAIRLRKAGYIVYAGARRLERMNHLQQQGIHIISVDVTDDSSMSQAVDRIINEQGHLDILINNAGYGSYGALEDVPLTEAKYQFDVNLFGLARLTQLVLPHMRKNRYGKIINISSIGGKIYEPLGAWYHATKFAVEGLSDCLRLELKGFGIDVIVIEPGGIKTEWSGIAGEKLLQTSGNTAYKKLATSMANMFINSTSGSNPNIIAKIIEKSLKSKNPKTRYAAGLGAKPFLFLRKILSDKAYDRFWMFMVKRLN